jgi:chromosomal replication initiator protein
LIKFSLFLSLIPPSTGNDKFFIVPLFFGQIFILLFEGCFVSMEISIQNFWAAVLGQLQLRIPKPSYETWLKDTFPISMDKSSLCISVPSAFASEFLGNRLHQVIVEVVSSVADRPLSVEYKVISSEGAHPASQGSVPGIQAAPSAGSQLTSLYSNTIDNHSAPAVDSRYSFDTFVTGASNQLAYAAARAVADGSGTRFNPLFIYSGVGLGKTHLLHAISSYASSRGEASLYVTTEQFTNAFIRSIRERKTDEFRAKVTKADIVLLDDVQFLSGKEQTQEGLFHIFNELHRSQRQIVLACDRPPSSVSLLEDRLRSRFEWGLIVDIQKPEIETKVAILQQKAAIAGFSLSDTMAFEIAGRSPGCIRSLEGGLNRVLALADFFDSTLSVDLVEQALPDGLVGHVSEKVTADLVIRTVASYYKTSPEILKSKTRAGKTTHPQRIAMSLIDRTLGLPVTEVASLFGGWSPRTVRNSLKELARTVKTDQTSSSEISEISEELGIRSPA